MKAGIVLLILMVMLQTGYSVLEMTRFIHAYGWVRILDMHPHFIFELSVMWILYLAVPAVMWLVINKLIKMAKKVQN